MKLKNEEIGLYIDISDDLINRIRNIGLQHFSKEFGGILIGRYSEDRKNVLITETLLPQNYKSSKYSFERGTEGLKEKLFDLYNEETPLIYVGEWHTHPDCQPYPSSTDITALKEIAKHDGVNICSPIMLIVGLTLTEIDLGFYIYFKNTVYGYETV